MAAVNLLLPVVIFFIVPSAQCIFDYGPTVEDNLSRDQLITSYFDLGYSYKEIIAALGLIHSINLSVRHLKRILKRLSLKRKRTPADYESSLDEVIRILLKELNGSGRCLGYKSMWRRLTQHYGLIVTRDTVLELMWLIDPETMEQRKAKRLIRRMYYVPGPNYLWHIDGYDKLKPFGFAIHGCIDGFSRRIMWLEVGSSNNDPNIVAYYFLQCVEKLKCVPTLMRSDLGTENATVKLLQAFFRSAGQDRFAGVNSFLMGKSTSNQRIEAWWSILRKQGVQFWINFFKDLRACDLFRDDIVHQECARLCFMTLLQNELQSVLKEWNTHIIHTKKGLNSPSGKPDVMYSMPELFETRSYHTQIQNVNFQEIKNLYAVPQNDPVCHPYFRDLCNLLVPDIHQPTSFGAALDLYTKLIRKLRRVLML